MKDWILKYAETQDSDDDDDGSGDGNDGRSSFQRDGCVKSFAGIKNQLDDELVCFGLLFQVRTNYD